MERNNGVLNKINANLWLISVCSPEALKGEKVKLIMKEGISFNEILKLHELYNLGKLCIPILRKLLIVPAYTKT